MNRVDVILETLSAQRNAAMDRIAILTADLAMAREEIEELKNPLPAPNSGGGPGEEKSGGGPGEEDPKK